ncbi:MAG TPA: hypothetical protein VGI95_04945 [Caulobacteraceae bacterium]|jgi:hypothetical protein
MTRPQRSPFLALALAAASLAVATPAAADQAALLTWSQTAARGLFQLCRQDAPDAARVGEHGEIWGWPRFMGYLEHPDGYKRQAGGSSRRTFQDGDASTYVEATVQSGLVTSAAPAEVHYFRCNAASDQPINADLETYFTDKYGPPAAKTDQATVWLAGAAKGADPGDDDAALAAVKSAAAGAEATRVELTHDHGLDRAKLVLFHNGPVGN